MSEEKKCCKEKIVYLVLLVAIFLCSAVSAFYSYKTNSILASSHAKTVKTSITKDYAKNKTIEKAKESEKPTIVLFYADWCGYCQKFAPVFNDIVNTRKFKSKLSVAYVNGASEENQQYMTEYDIKGFPTVYMVNFKTNEKIRLNNGLLFTPNAKKELLNMFLDFASKNSN